MKTFYTNVILALVLGATGLIRAGDAPAAPFQLVATMSAPAWAGKWDHMGAFDAGANRIFATSEKSGTVEVFDLQTNRHVDSVGKGVLHSPHSLLFRDDLHRLYVVDGNHQMGGLSIFDSNTFALIKTIPLPKLADWSNYDPVSKRLYINANGSNNDRPDSTISVIDTTSMEIVGHIVVDDSVIADFALESTGPLMYTGMRNKNYVAVIDREKQAVVATWPVTLGTGMGHMGIDSGNHRLYINCRNGVSNTVIIDTLTGKEVGSFLINKFSDELMVDVARKRIYIVAAGPKGAHLPTLEAFQQIDPDHYKSLGSVVTGEGAQTGGYIPDRSQVFVAVPGTSPTKILIYQILE